MLLCPIIGEVTFDQLVKVTVYVEEEDQKGLWLWRKNFQNCIPYCELL